MPRPGSLANILMELEISTGTTPYRIQVDQFVQDTQIETSTGSTFNATITLFDNEDILEDLFLVAGLNRGVRFRWNWAELGLDDAPQFEGSIIRYTPTFMPQGIQFVLEILATAVLPTVLDKRVRAYAAGRKISDIVQEIADERQWPTVDFRGNPTIEPTGASIDHPFNSTDESDMRFIAEQLKDQAVNAAGQGGYLFYFDTHGTVHFHTRTFLPPIAHTYTFARDLSGEVLSFTPTDTSAFAFLQGGGNAKYRSQSSLDATQTTAEGTIADGVDDNPEIVEETSTAVANLGTGTHAAINLMSRDADELSRLAKAVRERARDFQLLAEMQALGTHDVELLDYLDIRYIRKNGQPHYLSGRFRTMRIQHSIGTGGWTTTFGLTRDGLQASTEGTIPRENVVTVSPAEFS